MTEPTPESAKLSWVDQAFAAWPMALTVVGGAIGGACGGAAWALNHSIMKGDRSKLAKYGLCLLSGLGAAAVYVAAVTLLAVMFPAMFPAR